MQNLLALLDGERKLLERVGDLAHLPVCASSAGSRTSDIDLPRARGRLDTASKRASQQQARHREQQERRDDGTHPQRKVRETLSALGLQARDVLAAPHLIEESGAITRALSNKGRSRAMWGRASRRA